MTASPATSARQGVTAGLLIPAGQTILGQAVGPSRLGRVMATLGVAVTAAPAIGPIAGGVVVDAASWSWLFLINLPIGALGLILGRRYIPRGAAVTTAQLPDATSQVNILQRLGGALGGAIFAVVLATRLSGGTDAAFHASFRWLTAASALGLASAAWLTVAERSTRGPAVPASAALTTAQR